MFKKLALSFLLLSSLTLVACTDNETVDVKDKEEEKVQSEKKVDKEKDSKEDKSDKKDKAKETKKVGTRTNPVKLTEVAVIEETIFDENYKEYDATVDLSVVESLRGEEAYNKLMEMYEYNEKPDEGYEWVLVKAKVKLTDAETEDYSYLIGGFEFDFLSESGDTYDGDNYAVTEPEFSFELFKGNEKEGYMAGLVKKGEKAMLRYDSFKGQVYFNLE